MFEDMIPLKDAESLYVYSSCSDISSRAGLIGYMRADFGEDGKSFYHTWNDYDRSMNTDGFKDGLGTVINHLRKKDGPLYSRDALRKFCNHYCETRLPDSETDYGIRIDDGTYTYLMRFNPNKGEYNLYCYCYLTRLFEQRLKDAAKGIRFIIPECADQLRIADGARIRIIDPSKKTVVCVCRYIDEYHAVIGSSIYHIYEFAESIKADHKVVLPEKVYATGIDWDIAPDDEGNIATAEDLDLPCSVAIEIGPEYDDVESYDELLDRLTDKLSDDYGYCIRGLEFSGMEHN